MLRLVSEGVHADEPTRDDETTKGEEEEEENKRKPGKVDTQNVSEEGTVEKEIGTEEKQNKSDKGDEGNEHNRKNGTETEDERTTKKQDVGEKNGIEIEDPVCITLEFYRLVNNEAWDL